MNQSIFDKSFETEGKYLILTKSGFKIFFSKRSAIWDDKFKSPFVTLQLIYFNETHGEEGLQTNIFTTNRDAMSLDLRYNDISGVMEW